VKGGLRREAAELQEKRLGDASAAYESIAAALGHAPSEESLERELLRLATASGRFAEAGAALSGAAASVEEPGRAAELFRAAASVRSQQASDPVGALDDTMAALRLAPRDRKSALEAIELAGAVEGGDASAAAEAWVLPAFAMRAIDPGVTTALEQA